jgi:hypothetical protein
VREKKLSYYAGWQFKASERWHCEYMVGLLWRLGIIKDSSLIFDGEE